MPEMHLVAAGSLLEFALWHSPTSIAHSEKFATPHHDVVVLFHVVILKRKHMSAKRLVFFTYQKLYFAKMKLGYLFDY
jgi:hypothetical protein